MVEFPARVRDDVALESMQRATEGERTLEFRFTGSGSEYFRIWIVNTLLTILTLGIYSAWAKVRTKQYFYRNTWLEGSSFEYLANPIAILKGRLIVGALLLAVFGASRYSTPLYFALIAWLVAATPLLVVSALSFNARNSAFRNTRFAFAGRVGEAAGVYWGMLLFQAVSCGLAYPYAQWRITQFIASRHFYGDLQFTWVGKSAAYYRAYLMGIALSIPGYALLVAVIALSESFSDVTKLVVLLPGYALLFVPAAFLKARLANLLFDNIRIGPHALASKQRGRELLKLYVVNTLAIAASLGLLIPWATIRLAKYRSSTLSLNAVGSLESGSLLEGNPGAFGDAALDLGDIDLGIGA